MKNKGHYLTSLPLPQPKKHEKKREKSSLPMLFSLISVALLVTEHP
jgi:hypothetical protein